MHLPCPGGNRPPDRGTGAKGIPGPTPGENRFPKARTRKTVPRQHKLFSTGAHRVKTV